jgi:hypothetical protein
MTKTMSLLLLTLSLLSAAPRVYKSPQSNPIQIPPHSSQNKVYRTAYTPPPFIENKMYMKFSMGSGIGNEIPMYIYDTAGTEMKINNFMNFQGALGRQLSAGLYLELEYASLKRMQTYSSSSVDTYLTGTAVGITLTQEIFRKNNQTNIFGDRYRYNFYMGGGISYHIKPTIYRKATLSGSTIDDIIYYDNTLSYQLVMGTIMKYKTFLFFFENVSLFGDVKYMFGEYYSFSSVNSKGVISNTLSSGVSELNRVWAGGVLMSIGVVFGI